MNDAVRRPFWLALAASLLLHLLALAAPGWGLPLLDDEPERSLLDATLTVPVQAQPVPPPEPAPPPKKRPRPRPAPVPEAPVPEAPVPEAPVEPLAAPAPEIAPEPAPEPEPGEEAPPAAVPPAPTFAGIWPGRGRIVYQVTRGEGGLIVGQAEHVWRHDGETYVLRAVTETVGLAALFRPAQVVQESRGMFVAAGLQPLEFKTERDGKLTGSARFDASQGQIFLGNGKSAPLVAAAQDLLSLFHQLGAMPLDVPEFALTVTTGRKVASYTVVGDAQKLDTVLGERDVRHLTVTGDARDDATEIWLDDATHLPLKIRHRDRKGEIFDQTATAVELEKPE
jgi:hypothetical protein